MSQFPDWMRPAIQRANERITAAMGTTIEDVRAASAAGVAVGATELGDLVRRMLSDKLAPGGVEAVILLTSEQGVTLHEQVHEGNVSCSEHRANIAAAIATAVLYGWELAQEMGG